MNASSLLPPWRAALVVGLGQSGLSALRLLASAGIPVRAYDRRDALALGPTLEALPEAASAELLLGEPEVPEAAFAGVDAVVLSPGVPPSPVRARQELHAPQAIVHGELSLALLALRRAWPELPTVLVTGTNGKSTVTSLTGALLAAGGMRVFCGGNLGTPLADLALSALQGAAPPDALVIECSSFQLETLERHPTAVAMILNVTPDHLDRYASIADYAATKGRIFTGLRPGGLALLDAGDPWTASLRALVPAGAQVELVDDPSGGAIVGAGPGAALVRGEESIDRGLLALAGRHNSKNALFALAAARHLGVSVADCERGLAAFRGLPHRMVAVGERDGVIYYDDSKATNV
ncbi:MAG: UDP-N-acetylmuramoyl-L-alanine--D-glutamate ligase, partial [Myxococcales bacterium]|nr:UDP-N-acetylmuramoyl-L-alanine--D-glutamate ligase [Myxococcales bacterium]